MQFKTFYWLSHYGIRANIPYSTDIMASVKIIFGAFLIKQLFHSRLLDNEMIIANSMLRASLAIIISHPTRVRVIIEIIVAIDWKTSSAR